MRQFTISSLSEKDSWPSERTILYSRSFSDTSRGVARFHRRHPFLCGAYLTLFIQPVESLWLSPPHETIGRLFLMWKVVFIVMLFLWSFSSGSAVQRCCFLLNVAQILALSWAAAWASFLPTQPPPTPLLCLYLGLSVGVAAFNVSLKRNPGPWHYANI